MSANANSFTPSNSTLEASDAPTSYPFLFDGDCQAITDQ
jgi:hypothetical protein